MADISKLQVGEDVYDIKDSEARYSVGLVQGDVGGIKTRLDSVESDVGNIGIYVEETETLIIRE